MNKLIYFDSAASYPLNKTILKKIYQFLNKKNNFGNPISKHCYGLNLELNILNSKYEISKIINSNSDEIIFTSCATESNNLALKGLLKSGDNIITNNIEHKSILNTCNSIKNLNIIYVKIEKNGIIKNNNLLKLIFKKKIKLISISHVNNEIGVTQNIKSIGNICKIFNIIFHVDATQSIGKRYINVKKFNIDLLSFSSHKIYGPIGIGALYIKNYLKKIITPLIHGGDQQDGLRAGTLPTYLIIGFSEACKLLNKNLKKNRKYILKLNNYFIKKLKTIKLIKINYFKHQIPDIIHIYIKKINFNSFNNALKFIAFSHGSACNIKSDKNILEKLKYKTKYIKNIIRLSININNNQNEINYLINIFKKYIKFFKI